MKPSDTESRQGTCYDPSMPEPDDQNLLNFIATTVETLRVRVDTIGEQMAGMATKVDLANLKDELKDEMPTKADLARVESQMATKDGLARLETTMHGEFERVHLRIDSLDRGMGSRMGFIETDVSRLRSVLYLLVKDKPDMLRLLGQPTSGETRPQG